jgi:hypothetical protein
MKITKYILPAVLLILFLLFSQPCAANPINPDFPISGRGNIVLVLWILCPLIEASLIIYILRRILAGRNAKVIAFIFIFLLNQITILATWHFGMKLLHSANHNSVYLAELIPLSSEFVILLGFFYVLYKLHITSEPVKPGRMFLIVFAVNLATFLVGLAFYRYWPTPYTPYPVKWFPWSG